jgi:hypothetical protein
MLNFPTSPTLNQIFTSNGKTWTWSGNGWRVLEGINVSLFTSVDGGNYSDTPGVSNNTVNGGSF